MGMSRKLSPVTFLQFPRKNSKASLTQRAWLSYITNCSTSSKGWGSGGKEAADAVMWFLSSSSTLAPALTIPHWTGWLNLDGFTSAVPLPHRTEGSIVVVTPEYYLGDQNVSNFRWHAQVIPSSTGLTEKGEGNNKEWVFMVEKVEDN